MGPGSGCSRSTGSGPPDEPRARGGGQAVRRGGSGARSGGPPLRGLREALPKRRGATRRDARVGCARPHSRGRGAPRCAGADARRTLDRRLKVMQTSLPVAERPRRPEWMKVRAPSASSKYFDVKKLIHGASLHTICEEARCPNIAECWGRGTATFQILGDTCTRACRYCYVHSGKPDGPPDPLEPLRLAQTAARMGLKHVVVTSVDRDDLADRGAGHYAATIRALKAKLPQASVEVLTPDFLGYEEGALATVLAERPEVFNHNIETVRRLHPRMRGAKASCEKGLLLLECA